MSVNPYTNFNEWEKDMDRIRMHPQDEHLINHVRNRVHASSTEIQTKVNEYLMDMQFEQNPIAAGLALARKSGKVFFLRHPQDPWWYV